jgi:hypothetical protein
VGLAIHRSLQMLAVSGVNLSCEIEDRFGNPYGQYAQRTPRHRYILDDLRFIDSLDNRSIFFDLIFQQDETQFQALKDRWIDST